MNNHRQLQRRNDTQSAEMEPQQSPASSFFQIILGVFILLLALVGLFVAHNSFLQAAPILVWMLVVIVLAAVPLYLIGKGAKGAFTAYHHMKRIHLATQLSEVEVEKARVEKQKAEEELEAMKDARRRENEQHQVSLLEAQLPPDISGNYPAIWDRRTGRVFRPEPGQYIQPVPQHWAPHQSYAYRDTSTHVSEEEAQHLLPAGEDRGLPSLVRYTDIRHLIPSGHTLLGVGENRSIESRAFACLDTCWICGGSKTGKTNTVALKVEEAYTMGRRFIVIDPHKYKNDSLYNSIRGYADAFLMPVAQRHDEIMKALQAFLAEGKRREMGSAYEDEITLIVDEIGSLTGDKGKTEEQKQLYSLLYNIARKCGQEWRGFGMSGMFISQNAVGLAWLRSFAMTIIVHKLLMENERRVATNNNMAIVRDMDTWPRGRVLVYGLDIEEGQLLLQQPVFTPRMVDADPQPRTRAGTRSVPSGTPGTPGSMQVDDDAQIVPEPENISFFEEIARKKAPQSGTLLPALEPLPKQAEQARIPVPASTDGKRFTPEQEGEFIRRFKACGSIKETLSQMHVSYGRYQKHASQIVYERKLRKA
jgi:hypothetical protein